MLDCGSSDSLKPPLHDQVPQQILMVTVSDLKPSSLHQAGFPSGWIVIMASRNALMKQPMNLLQVSRLNDTFENAIG
jgi:hypothetical protein